MNAKEVAAMTGVSVRTLHHYDRIGLLCPDRNQENGYRVYSDKDLDQLQQILFFKECGFSLGRIGQLLSSPTFDREKAFDLQKKYLLHEQKRIGAMLDTLNKTMKAAKGEIIMSQTEKFGGFDFTHNPYEEEARRLWGDDVVQRSNDRLAAMSQDERNGIARGMEDLFSGLAKLRTEDPASQAAQAAMEEMYRYFNGNFGYHYSLEAFAGLGQMYINDSRFTKNIDQYGQGLSAFLAQAMDIYAKSKG